VEKWYRCPRIESIEACRGILLEACRLQRLTNDFLDASKVESVTSLTYAMKKVRIKKMILDIVIEIER
jgi:hypothetical protein